uniref:Uncharacterized protein n=1 Tax=Stomoxys calcitrans TaxID=35570 RepID=A0A1I8P7J0_STOCA
MRNMKQLLVICAIILSASAAFERPDWYPENGSQIEADCMSKIAVGDDILNKLRKLQIDDNEKTRDLILCCLRNTNVYRPGQVPEADRIAVAFQQSLKLNCEEDLINGCIPKYKDEKPENYQFFRIIKCIYDEAPARCKP